MTPKNLKKLIFANAPDFADCVSHVPYEEKGITDFEGLCLWSLIKHFQARIFIESGVSKGRSTQMLGEFMKPLGIKKVYSFEKSDDHEGYVRKKILPYGGVDYRIGSSSELVDGIRPSLGEESVGALIDGPKHGEAYIELMASLSKIKNLSFIVSHDCYPGSPTSDSLKKGYEKFFRHGHEMFLTGPSFDSKKQINASLRDRVRISHPDKLKFLDENCYYVGVIARTKNETLH